MSTGRKKPFPGKKMLLFAAAMCILLFFLASRAGILGFAQTTYDNAHFGIETFVCSSDRDGDGINDQADILQSARSYMKTKPSYKSRYYSTGYPDDGYGTCADVAAFAMRDAGYDLQDLVDQDIHNSPSSYQVPDPDRNIDFRRVRNLDVWLRRHAETLTLDLGDHAAWQGGDIVVFRNHIGIVSDRRNARGVPLVLHHSRPLQLDYEEDILERRSDLIGHYRVCSMKQ